MNQKQAFIDTLALAEAKGVPELPGSSLGLEHLRDMLCRIETYLPGDFSVAKMGRWLGWAQCAVVAAGVGITLEDMKKINMSNAGEGAA